MSAVYRVRQFLLAAGAWVQPRREDGSMAGRLLEPMAADLFQRMPAYDRRHALRVVRSLRHSGYSDTDLLAAALLHDAGKTAMEKGRLRLWHRVAVVLADGLSPSALDRIGEEQARTWRRPFFVQRHHAEIGAQCAERAGCTPRTVELIRRHEDPRTSAADPLLAALQSADDAS